MMKAISENELLIDAKGIKNAAMVFRALNHSLRRQMLSLLSAHSRLTVTELYTMLGLEQSVISQHLAVLRNAGLVVTFRDGKHVFYSVDHDRIEEVHKRANRLFEGLPRHKKIA